MDAPINSRRGKLLACFRPADDEPVSYSSSLQPSADEVARRNKRRLRRSFSAALKAIIFKSALKSQSENHHKKGFGENQHENGLRSNIVSRGKSFVTSLKKNLSRKQCMESDQILWSQNSTRSSLFSTNPSSPAYSSSASSQLSSPARSETDSIHRAVSLDRRLSFTQTKPTKKRKSGRKCAYNVPTLDLCILMMCLFALIWGKAFAVVTCTSAWLFFAPSRRRPKLRRTGSLEVVDSEEYKKRVIMEGWLERGGSRVSQY